LRGEEGEVLSEYKDHLGYSTIGVGRLIDKRKGGGITTEEAAYLLGNDVDKVTAQLDKRLPWWTKLDEARQGVLVNMAFQMGIDGLLGFKNTLNMIKAGQYESAARGMLQSKWAQQTPSRAKRMAEQMRTGVWQYKPGF
jgi:lysozyme